MSTLDFRTKKTYEAYERLKVEKGLMNGCPLCKAESIKEFEFWRIIPNNFPYDRIAKIHDMLVPKQHKDEAGLTKEELGELANLKATVLNETYGFIIEALKNKKSIPAHFHLHLIVPRDTI